jgi:hypothetical protein
MYDRFILEDADLDKPKAGIVADRNRSYFRAAARSWINEAAKPMTAEAKRFGYDIDVVEMLKDKNFNMREFSKQIREGKMRLSETVVTSMIYSLANVATTASAASAYQLVDCVYRKLCEVAPSKKSEETYFALQRGDLPLPVSEQQAAPESLLGGVLTRIKNYDFARIWRHSRNAEDDDQTGQLAKMGQIIGESMAYTEEFWAITVLFYAYQAANIRPGGARTNGSGIIPGRCIAGQAVADGGPTTTAGDINLTNAEALITAADYVTDIAGNYVMVNPDYILVAGSRRLVAKKIFGQAADFNPSGASTTAGQGPTPAGLAGAWAINPLAGALAIHHSPFVNKVRTGLDSTNPPWAIGEAGKGWCFQDREALEVLQEADNAGESFRQRSRGTRAWRRFGAGVREGEFVLVGN